MSTFTSPEVVVQRQLDAYNAKNLAAFLSTYDIDAKQFELGGKLLAEGYAEIKARTELRFTEPNLHAKLLRRVVMGNVVIDHEDVMRMLPEGAGNVELVCIYLVEQGKIQSATFSMSPVVLIPQN